MSVEVILSSKQVELDQNSQAVLNLKATFATVAPSISALYKVRANSKNTIEVRPSFGVLRAKNQDDAIASLNIKYSGSLDDLQKIKIQVNWVWGEVPEKPLHYNQFSELYASFKQRLGSERNHMVGFTSQKLMKQSQISLQLHEVPSSINQSQEELTKPEQKQKNEGLLSQKSLKPIKKDENNRKISFKVLLIGVLVAFVLGIFIGFQIEPLIKSNVFHQQESESHHEGFEKLVQSEIQLIESHRQEQATDKELFESVERTEEANEVQDI